MSKQLASLIYYSSKDDTTKLFIDLPRQVANKKLLLLNYESPMGLVTSI